MALVVTVVVFCGWLTCLSLAVSSPRSLVQACRKEIPRLCEIKTDATSCLIQKAYLVQDETCKKWLSDNDACREATRQHCRPVGYLDCLAQLTNSQLGDQCASSLYLRSVRRYFRWKNERLRSGNARA